MERSDEGSGDRQIAAKKNGMDTRERKEDGVAPLVPYRSFAFFSRAIRPILASLEDLLQWSSFRKGQQVVSLVDPVMLLSFQWDRSS
jgi:hypothetical protein